MRYYFITLLQIHLMLKGTLLRYLRWRELKEDINQRWTLTVAESALNTELVMPARVGPALPLHLKPPPLCSSVESDDQCAAWSTGLTDPYLCFVMCTIHRHEFTPSPRFHVRAGSFRCTTTR